MKKYLVIFLMLIASIFILPISTRAEESRYENYKYMVDNGYLDSEISFEEWNAYLDENERLEKEFENEEIPFYIGKLRSGFELERGDILVTNGTSKKGLTGHAAIALDSENILHIAGPHDVPDTITKKRWIEKYHDGKTWTKVYRHSDSDIASSAADWAEETYKGSNAEYKITNDTNDTSKTYCSKIVWQAYYFGTGEAEYLGSMTISPYLLPRFIYNVKLVGKYK